MSFDDLTIEEVRAIQIADIRARLAARTPGSWIATLDNDGWCVSSVPDEGTPQQRMETLARLGSGSPASDTSDACFIASAPNDIAILLAEVERLRAKDDAWDKHVCDREPSSLMNRQVHEETVQLESERAFARGAEAMRNQVLGVVEVYAQTPVESDYAAGRAWTADRIAEHVRNLPIPEVTP